MRIIIPSSQNRAKDCFAPAANLDLVLRSNGEEEVMVIDGLGNVVKAGFDRPTVAPTLTLLGAGNLLDTKWYAYEYVYASEVRYPLVENAQTGGGSLGPRSNPSPPQNLQIIGGDKNVRINIPYSERSDVDHIWIYRTDAKDTQAEAIEDAGAGTMYFLASIPNANIIGTTNYTDSTTTVTGGELIELDNYAALMFAYCVFVDPYFFGFANTLFKAPISVTAAGLVTLTNYPTDRWYRGRDTQLATMDDVTTGGFDNQGTYYFRYIDAQTAQLSTTISGTSGTVGYSGTTTIYLKGPSTTLYRSKPRNPFSWGQTSQAGVPSPYVFKVGGGVGTAIAEIPLISLLKLDTEGPNKSYVLSLKQAGTQAFEASKRTLSDLYSASNQFCQFQTPVPEGGSLLWFFDYKFLSMCKCDGSSNISLSSKVFEALRNLSTDDASRLFSHGIYDAHSQISIMFITGINSPVRNNIGITYHHETDTWGILPQMDVNCSTSMLNPSTNEQISIVGTEGGAIGRIFAPGFLWNWMDELGTDTFRPMTTRWPMQAFKDPLDATNLVAQVLTNNGTDMDSNDLQRLQNVWCWFVLDQAVVGTTYPTSDIVGFGRISEVTFAALDPNPHKIHFDIIMSGSNVVDAVEVTSIFDIDPDWGNNARPNLWIFPGAIPCIAKKFINLKAPTVAKKLTEVWLTANEVYSPTVPAHTDYNRYPWIYTFVVSVQREYGKPFFLPGTNTTGSNYKYLVVLSRDRNNIFSAFQDATYQQEDTFYSKTPVPVDMLRSFVVEYRELGYAEFQFRNFSLVFENAG